MIRALREEFLQRFTPERYAELLRRMSMRTRTQIQIRIAETPVFLPADLVKSMVDAGAEMTRSLLADAEYLRRAAATVPPAYRVAGGEAHPHFMTVDFGLVCAEDGTLQPRLVELQAFPSVYGYQAVLGEEYRRCFEIAPELSLFLNGHSDESYWALLQEVIVGKHAPENVVLLEVTPSEQKTLPDFHIHEDRLGIRTVDIATVRQRGSRLFYQEKGREVPIERIYNRAIVDELLRRGIEPGFDLCADLHVEWAGHPNWYFQISKFALPFLRHPFVPPAAFLDAWMDDDDRERVGDDLSELVLKPLFSFAGKGITFAPSIDQLRAILQHKRGEYLLQRRVPFANTVSTPAGETQAEVRILYVWPEEGALQAVNTLVRLGRGTMMGVDHNRGAAWVGGSAGVIAYT